MAPIKVLHLIPTLSSGGAERQLVNLVRSTAKEKVDHVVCVINDADFFAGDIREAGYRVVELKIKEKRPFLRAARAFGKVMAVEDPDVVHSWLYDANISSRLAGFLNRGTPIITSLQLADYEPDGIRAAGWNPAKVRGLKFIDQITARFSRTHFVACSDFVNHSYKRHFGIDPNRIETIYNAVDIAALSTEDGADIRLREELRLPEDAFIYLNVGRLDPQKNHDLILDAFAQAKEIVPTAYLLLAGTGPLDTYLKKKAKDLGIEDRIFFLGRRSDVGALMEFADVFVFPSLFEGLPVALAEAMFKSLPCIASRIEVFEEVIEDRKTGLLVDPRSAEQLRDAMVELYGKPQLRKSLGENAHDRASKVFNAALTATQWEELYQRIAKRKHG